MFHMIRNRSGFPGGMYQKRYKILQVAILLLGETSQSFAEKRFHSNDPVYIEAVASLDRHVGYDHRSDWFTKLTLPPVMGLFWAASPRSSLLFEISLFSFCSHAD